MRTISSVNRVSIIGFRKEIVGGEGALLVVLEIRALCLLKPNRKGEKPVLKGAIQHPGGRACDQVSFFQVRHPVRASIVSMDVPSG